MKSIKQLFDEAKEKLISFCAVDPQLLKSPHVQTILKELHQQLTENVTASIRVQWGRDNTEAMEAFIKRKDGGLNLSQRLWKQCKQLQDEMSQAIKEGIQQGTPANKTASQIRQYLNNNHKSFSNAMRVARTETNMAYRNSNYEQWRNDDQVIGIHIEVSDHPGSHGQGARSIDICDQLAGDYPKDFRFEGWHPNCRCIATPILIPKEERQEQEDAFADGKKFVSKHLITKVPTYFKTYANNFGGKSKNVPYAVQHNKTYIK